MDPRSNDRPLTVIEPPTPGLDRPIDSQIGAPRGMGQAADAHATGTSDGYCGHEQRMRARCGPTDAGHHAEDTYDGYSGGMRRMQRGLGRATEAEGISDRLDP